LGAFVPSALELSLCSAGDKKNILELDQKISPSVLPRHTPGSAMLPHFLDQSTVEDSSCQRFVTFWSPRPTNADEDEDDDEYEDEMPDRAG
jgi:hypothetical protein